MDFPIWWEWELELTPHIEKRMYQRGITEKDLRRMLSTVSDIRPDRVVGRWIADTRPAGKDWHIIIEPDNSDKRLVLITAYPQE